MNATGQAFKVAVIAVGVTMAALAIFAVLARAQFIFLTLFAAIVIGETARPAIDRLSIRLPRWLAATVAFVALYAAFALVWALPFYALAPQFVALAKSLPTRIQAALGALDLTLRMTFIRSTAGASVAWLTENVPQLLTKVIYAQANINGMISILLMAMVLAVFWMTSSGPLHDFVVSLFPEPRRNEVRSVLAELGGKLGLYARGTFINGAIVACGCAIGLALLKVPNALALGLCQGPLIAVPYVGTLIGVIVVMIVLLASQGLFTAALAAAIVIIITTIEGTFISPLIFKRQLDVDPLATIVGIAVAGTLFGFVGIALAVPAVAVLQTLTIRVIAPAVRRYFANE